MKNIHVNNMIVGKYAYKGQGTKHGIHYQSQPYISFNNDLYNFRPADKNKWVAKKSFV